MAAELITTTFVAHPEQVDDAYALYRERISQAGVDIVACSPRPVPVPQDSAHAYTLWDLRTEAAYAQLERPESMALYELNALVRHEVDLDNDDEDQRLHEWFFLESDNQPAAFPGTLKSGAVELERTPAGPVHSYLVYYLAAESNVRVAERLYSELCQRVRPLLAPEPLDETSDDDKLGPLWVRDGVYNAAGQGDGWYSMGKQGWEGWFITDLGPEEVAQALSESLDPGSMVLARLVHEEF